MLNRVPEESRQAEGAIKGKAISLAGLLSQEPLKFQFYYGDENNPDIINTIYLKDSDAPLKLYLKVFNDSNEVVTFKDPKGSENPPTGSVWDETPSEKNCHFHLHFEKDLGLNSDEIEIDLNSDSGQWQVNCHDETNFFAVYFLHKQELRLDPHANITICFSNLTANNRTVKTSNVALLYGGNNQVSTGQNQEDIEDEITSRIAISVINHLSKTQIPLQFRVLGSNKILNDGTTKNTLTLKVINSPLSNNERPILSLDQSSKFIVSFEQGEHQDALVATTSQLNNVRIAERKEGWLRTHTASSTQWSFTPRDQFKQWKEGQGIELSITNLVTSSASGLACIYIDYQNIGSYPDGRLVIPIEKTPLLYSEENVGIGINQPQAKLDVGGNAVISGKVGIGTTTPKIHLAIGDDDTGLQQQGDGILAIYTDNFARVRVDKNGNVGIGINEPPQAKLHVGGNALISNKVGISIGTTTPKIHLAIGDDDTGLDLDGYQNLSLMVRGEQRVAMPHGKPVVISGGLAVGLDSTSIERILCGRLVVREDIKPMDPKSVSFPPMVSMALEPDGLALYGNEISKGFRINAGNFQIEFTVGFNPKQVDKAIVLLTSLDAECTVDLVSISPFRVITRDAKTQKLKDASFNFVIILPTSSDRKYLYKYFQ
ncbi:hypothetical protein N0824_03632 [Microcystis sp. 0824]|uniref:hypothetical protein n=1 Tax=Microcystis sp. 0824 TaxID=1502726 RepID=UPI000D0C1AA3|nr:hypothetical protein [Microcystis sp. 0824]GBF55747.1 hypothetical protein N0824_03632 [Microcystis sp. 0824]